MHRCFFFGLGCSIWVCDMTLLILPGRRCSRPFYLLVAYLSTFFFSSFILTPPIVLLGNGPSSLLFEWVLDLHIWQQLAI